MTDYAYKKIKLTSNQRSFAAYVDYQYKGRCDHIGIDYGGWTAHNKIVTALKKKGVLISDDKNKYVLVVGEPLVVADPKFDKPYLKIKKEILEFYNGYEFTNYDAQIYLDPRGDCKFYIILPYDISQFVDIEDRAAIMKFDDVKWMVAKGYSVKEVINNAANMTTEYKLIGDAVLNDVLHIVFTTSESKCNIPYRNTGLTLQYFKLLECNNKLYNVDKNGRLCLFDYHESKENGVTIPWNEEREFALESLRMKVAKAGDELRSILFNEHFITMLDNQSVLKLEYDN